jgi:hypothetical protein
MPIHASPNIPGSLPRMIYHDIEAGNIQAQKSVIASKVIN